MGPHQDSAAFGSPDASACVPGVPVPAPVPLQQVRALFVTSNLLLAAALERSTQPPSGSCCSRRSRTTGKPGRTLWAGRPSWKAAWEWQDPSPGSTTRTCDAFAWHQQGW